MEIWIIVTLVSLLFSGLFSGAEMAFVTSDRVRVEIDVKQGGIIGRVLRRFYANPQFFISSILVGNNIVLVIYGMGAAKLLDPLQEPLGIDDGTLLLMQTIASTIVIIITGEFLPKTIFRINPNASMRFIAIPIFLFYIILYPHRAAGYGHIPRTHATIRSQVGPSGNQDDIRIGSQRLPRRHH